MASPQLERGFTMISNELLEAIYGNLVNGEWLKIVLYIIRITYGYKRKTAKTSFKSVATGTRIVVDRVVFLLSELRIRRILTVDQTSKGCATIGINKNYEEWVLGELASYREELDRIKTHLFK